MYHPGFGNQGRFSNQYHRDKNKTISTGYAIQNQLSLCEYPVDPGIMDEVIKYFLKTALPGFLVSIGKSRI